MLHHITQGKSYLQQAQSSSLPLLNRVRAIGSLAQSLDAAFTDNLASAPYAHAQAQSTFFPPFSLLSSTVIGPLLSQATHVLHETLLPQLRRSPVCFNAIDQLSESQYNWLLRYFHEHIYPVLIPLAIDASHPFPQITSNSIYLLVLLQKQRKRDSAKPESLYVCIKVPPHQARWLEVPSMVTQTTTGYRPQQRIWVWLEEVVRHFAATLFSGFLIQHSYQFRLLRAPGVHPQNRFSSTQPPTQAETIARLDIEETMPSEVITWLLQHIDIPTEAVIRYQAPLALHQLQTWVDQLPNQPPLYGQPAIRANVNQPYI